MKDKIKLTREEKDIILLLLNKVQVKPADQNAKKVIDTIQSISQKLSSNKGNEKDLNA